MLKGENNLFDFNKYIDFIDSILPEINLSPQKHQELTALRNKVVDRYNDPTLYLSMLSGFSAGKSTMINKLIGNNLLKTARQATTSVPTYIRHNSDSDTTISVHTVNDENYNLSENEQLKAFECLIDRKLPEEKSMIISMLTTDELYVQQKNDVIFNMVDAVTVNVPYGLEDLCIIDTPGVNPGADNTLFHAERTKYILREKADCVIILFPAHQSYTKDFQEFLDENAREFLSDAVFVITQMDVIDKEEREEVLKETKANLEQHFGIRNTNFLYCAAGMVGRDEYWTKQFDEFRDELYKHLRQRRSHMINKNLAELLKKLLEAVNTEIDSDNEELKRKLAVLEENSVPNLMTVLDEFTNKEKSRINKNYNSSCQFITTTAKELPSKIETEINTSLSACTTRTEVTNFAKNKLTEIISEKCKPIESKVKKGEDDFNQMYRGIKATMTEKMITYYGKISQLDSETEQIDVDDSFEKTTAEFSAQLSDIDADISLAVDLMAMAGGGIIAAAVFTALGPVGWVIGGVAGLLGGDYLFVDTARGKVKSAVKPKIPDIVSNVEAEAKKTLLQFKDSVISRIDVYKQELLDKYSEIYTKLDENFKSEQNQINSKLQANSCSMNQINLFLDELKQLKDKGV